MGNELTIQQQMAVDNRGGKLLVSAAAGSGKTKVLVDRLMKYLEDPEKPANLDEFLIITYTKAAAAELRGKIAAKLTEKIAEKPESRLQQQMQRLFLTKISTVHGFCGDVLREYAYRLDLSADFRVADENECRELRQQVLNDLLDRAYETAGEDPDFRAFVDTQGVGRNDRLVPELIEKVYDSAKCHLDPEKWLEECLEAANVEGCTDASQTLWGRYLMDDLMEYLDSQIYVLEQCVREGSRVAGLEKAVENLNQTLKGLTLLREAETWDQVLLSRDVPFNRYPSIRKCEDMETKDRIKAARDACKEDLARKLRAFADDSARILQDLNQSAAGTRGIVKLVRQFDREFSQAKKIRRIVDFGDLEHRTLDLLLGKQRTGPTAAAAEIAGRFREVMVDEYQDSNAVQDAIFSVLTAYRNNCFMVGDVKQSIYQFRLADPEIFLKKYADYADAEKAGPGEGRKILLSKNFRSGGEVIEAVNHVFETCMSPAVGGLYYGDGEALVEGIPHEPLPDPAVELYALQSGGEGYTEEAEFVAQRIQTMLEEKTLIRGRTGLRPVEPEDIVILLRSPGSAAKHFQRALESRGIRCASGGGSDLLKTREIGTLRALLQIIYNPRQDIPLLTCLASPLFNFSADELAALRSKRKYGSFYDAVMRDESEKSRRFAEVLEMLRGKSRIVTLTQLLEICLAETAMDSIYAAMEGGEARRANIQTFVQLAVDYEMGNHRNLGQFLDHLAALEEKGLISAGASGAGCVTIMSIHKSKGLEFPVVFLSNLSRKFNKESLQDRILCHKDLKLGLSVADTEYRMRYPTIARKAIAVKMEAESRSEELRVLYVAMTRARDRLVMTYMAQNLESKLQNLALRSDFDGGRLMCRGVNCHGDWVLLSALRRTEAGALFALGSKPRETVLKAQLWKIEIAEAPDADVREAMTEEAPRTIPVSAKEKIRETIAFRYPWEEATQAPSKQTATGRKGRIKDEEAAQDTQEKTPAIHRSWRRPSFVKQEKDGITYGNAMHAAMQFIRYDCCGSEEEVSREIGRLVEQGFLTREQGEMVSCREIAGFFQTESGRRLRQGCDHIREFKFSILDDAQHYGDNLQGEQVLLQGVVDCALLEEDGITILDFKTDRVTEDTLGDAVEKYRLQVWTYAEALARIYRKKIKGSKLYFFRLGKFADV